MTLFLIAIGAFIATTIGGLLALKFRDKLHLVLGFSAGAVIGVAFFDLLPEAFEMGSKYYDLATMALWLAVGFLVYLLLDRLILLHTHHHDDEGDHDHLHSLVNPSRGILGAGSLAVHSFLDGVAIGLGFQASAAVGIVVTIAVLAHDFSDGINTVNFILKNKSDRHLAFRWLMVDAAAPVLGVASTLLFALPESTLSIVLAMFAGFFLYIGASELIPESYHSHPKILTTFMTLLGAGVMFGVIRLAGL